MSHHFLLGKCLHELAQKPSRVALAWHQASGSTPYWGNFDRHARMLLSMQVLKFANHINSPVAVLTVKEHDLFFQHHICADAEPMQVPRGSKTITWQPRGSFLLAGAALQALDGTRARFGGPPLDAARRSTWEPRGSFLLRGVAGGSEQVWGLIFRVWGPCSLQGLAEEKKLTAP